MKTITVKQLASIKRVAMNVYPAFNKMQKIKDKMIALQEEYDELQRQIDMDEAGVKANTGHSVIELITKTNDTPAKYAPSDILKFNEETKVYEFTVPEVDLMKSCHKSDYETYLDTVKEDEEKVTNDYLNDNN